MTEFEIRPNRRITQGRKKLVAERTKFFELVSQGYGIKESARIVGVNYRTAKRWRSGVWTQNKKREPGTAAPTVVRPYRAPLSSPRFLSQDDQVEGTHDECAATMQSV